MVGAVIEWLGDDSNLSLSEEIRCTISDHSEIMLYFLDFYFDHGNGVDKWHFHCASNCISHGFPKGILEFGNCKFPPVFKCIPIEEKQLLIGIVAQRRLGVATG